MDIHFARHLRPALSAAAMREADRMTIEELDLPGFTLMESAGRAAYRCIEHRYENVDDKSVACLCGKGNNGGDALVLARLLYVNGATVTVLTMASPDALSPDAAKNYQILSKLVDYDTDNRIRFAQLDDLLAEDGAASSFDLVVDGLLGTGVTRELSGRYLDAVAWMNRCTGDVIALDVPTGLHTDTGEVLGDAVVADLTITMGALKAGLLLGEGSRRAGAIEAVEIGIPAALIRRSAAKYNSACVATPEAVRAWIPQRDYDAHKYGVGMALLVAGSKGLTGAAALAAQAAARSGAGAVICAASQEVADVLATKMTEVMIQGLPADRDGIIGKEALPLLGKHLVRAKSLLVGCGSGRRSGTQAFIRDLLKRTPCPTVVDADGLHALADDLKILKSGANRHWILTPHLGEFKRLAGADVDHADRVETVRRFARAWQCVLIFKGTPSVVGTPEGEVFINPTVNPALATAGSGDVLAGLCAGYLAQGLTPVKAALTALYVSGAAADTYTATHHPASMLASDLIQRIGRVVNEIVT